VHRIDIIGLPRAQSRAPVDERELAADEKLLRAAAIGRRHVEHDLHEAVDDRLDCHKSLRKPRSTGTE
jgi:hypothetical protein